MCDLKIDRMIEEVNDFDIEMFMIKDFELFNFFKLPMSSKACGKYIEQGLTIMNIKNIGFSETYKSMKYIKMSSHITQNYFPEIMGKMYIINTSTIFGTLWALVKPFIDEKTLKKIVVFKDDYIDALLQDVDPENLPKFLGGECECEGGCIKSDKGPWNP